MGIVLSPWRKNEKLYFYPQSNQISSQTGLIGRLRADFGKGNEFFSTWEDNCSWLKTEDFKLDLDEVINYFRFEKNGFLSNRSKLHDYLFSNDSAVLPADGNWYGFRAEHKDYSYFFRLKDEPGDYNMYCYCYKRDLLNSHIEEAEKGIRFITADYKDKFRIRDGDKIQIEYPNGEYKEFECRYIDQYHFELNSIYADNYQTVHIAEFAEVCEENKFKVKPIINESLTGINELRTQISLLNQAKDFIESYSRYEFQANDSIDYSDLTNINVAYTTTEDGEHEIQACIDLENFKIKTLLDNVLVREKQFENLNDMVTFALPQLNFADLTEISEDDIKKVNQQQKVESANDDLSLNDFS